MILSRTRSIPGVYESVRKLALDLMGPGDQADAMLTTTRPGLDELTSSIRTEARPGRGARDTAVAVADLLRRRTPSLDLLTEPELSGDGADFARHVLHT